MGFPRVLYVPICLLGLLLATTYCLSWLLVVKVSCTETVELGPNRVYIVNL